MGVFSGLRSLFSPSVRYVYGGDVGVQVENMDSAALYRTQPNLRAVVSFLADNAAQVPMKVHDRAGQNDRPRVTGSPAALLLQHPNPDMTPFEFKRWMYSDLLLYERFLMLVLPNAESDSGWEMRPVPNAWMASYNGRNPFAPESVDLAPPGCAPVRVPSGRFVLFHGYDPTDPMRQYSRISALKETLHEQVESNAFRRQMWRRGGRFNAFITRPKDVREWSEEAKKRFTETWKASWAGSEGGDAGGMPILEDGMEIRTVPFNSRDAQWADSVKLSREDVAGVYHVNPALIWPGSGQTYASARDNARALYNDTLAPLLMQATDRINMALLPMVGEEPSHYVVYDISIKTQGTLEERIAAMQAACGAPFMSREEVRALMDLPRDPDGELVVPLNVVTGGLASNHDTDPTRERYNAAPMAQVVDGYVYAAGGKKMMLAEADPMKQPVPRVRVNAESAGEGGDVAPKAPDIPMSRKARGDPAEGSADELEAVYRAFFERQAKSVIPKIESGAANWWNAERWNRELVDDLYPVALAQADAAGEDAVKELWPDEPGRKYGKRQTAAYIRKMCEFRAEAVNAATYRELTEAIESEGKGAGVQSKGLKSTVAGVFAFAIQHRAATAGAALAAGIVGFALHEACKQNKRRGESVYKTWRTTSGNPRSSHRALNGETVQMDETFSNGMSWPGDWKNGSAAEVAHCKCVLDVEVREKEEWTPGRVTAQQIQARDDLSDAEKAMLMMAVEDAKNPLGLEKSRELAGSMEACLEKARKTYNRSKTQKSYEETIGKSLSDIGDVYGMSIKGQYQSGRGLSSALPKGEEVWAVVHSRNIHSSVQFLGEDNLRAGNPDILSKGRYIDVKTPRGIGKAADRYKHAQVQCMAVGQDAGDIIISGLQYKGNFEEAIELAREFQEAGVLKNVHYVIPGQEAKSL